MQTAKANGAQAMDRLDYLNSCDEMRSGIDADEQRERRGLDAIFVEVGGRDAMEAIASLDQCPACDHAIAKIAGVGHNGPRTCAECWRKDSSLEGRWSGGGAARVHV